MSYRTKPPLIPISDLSEQAMYAQVKKFTTFKKATSPYYTCEPEMQPVRWHLWFDGRTVISLISEGLGPIRHWSEGPSITVQDFTTGTGLAESALGILAGSFGKKARGLGVIVHLADCSSMVPVKESFENLDKLQEVSQMVVNDPRQVMLGTATEGMENGRWRAVPIAGGKKNKIVLFRLSRADMEGLARLTEIDAPISVSVRSAQSEAIAACQWLAEGIEPESTGEGGAPIDGPMARIILLYYRKATIMVLYDENNAPSVIRHLPHADGKIHRDLPSEFSQLLKQAPLGVKNIAVTVFDFGEGGDEVNNALNSKQVAAGNASIFIQYMPAEEMTALVDSMGINLGLPGKSTFPAECLLEYKATLLGGKFGGGKKHIASLIRAAEDNYLDASTELRTSKVTASDMKMLLFTRYLRNFAVLAVVGIAAYVGFNAYSILTSEYWRTPEQDFASSKTSMMNLEKELAEIKRVEAILTPRNELWQNLELVMALFPESHDIQVADLRFSVDDQEKTMKWAISGYANEIGLATVRSLQNPQVLSDAFERVAKKLNAWTFMPGEGRTRRLSVREESNTSYSPTGVSTSDKYPLRFSVELIYSGASYEQPTQP